MNNKHPLIRALETVFQENSNVERAQFQRAYMKNNFHFFGITKPQRTILEKPLFKQHRIATVEELTTVIAALWHKQERDFHYAALELTVQYRKLWNADLLPLFEIMIRTNSWWDSVDTVAANLVGPLVARYPKLLPRMDTWITDENMWIRRTALLFQLKWKEQTDTKRLFEYCAQCMHEKEFFIRKAIGWVLREYSKTNPTAVHLFIEQHKKNLSRLSIREGSKYL